MTAVSGEFARNALPKGVMQSLSRGSSLKHFVEVMDPTLYGW